MRRRLWFARILVWVGFMVVGWFFGGGRGVSLVAALHAIGVGFASMVDIQKAIDKAKEDNLRAKAAEEFEKKRRAVLDELRVGNLAGTNPEVKQ